jgi:hypothetical protein
LLRKRKTPPATITEKMIGHGMAPILMAMYDELASKNKESATAIIAARAVKPGFSAEFLSREAS